MSEQVLAQVPSIFRWRGPRRGRTMFTAQAGRLTLTAERLIFQTARREPLVVPLVLVEQSGLTGRRIKNLTVAHRGASGTEWSTFATQQFGMPNGQLWVDQITFASAAARGEQAPLPASSPLAAPFSNAPGGEGVAHRPIVVTPLGIPGDPLARFHQAPPGAMVQAQGDRPFREFALTSSMVPKLVSWRILRTLDPDVVDPATGRVEIWGDVLAGGPIQYLHIAAGFRPDGRLRTIVAAEVLPGVHDNCVLGVFLDGLHHNLGAHEECRNLEGFTQRGVDVVLGVLDGERHKAGLMVVPQPPGPLPGPSPALQPHVVVPPSRDEAVALLRQLDAQARQDSPLTRVALATFIRQAAAACQVLDRRGPAAVLLDAAQAPEDPTRMIMAGDALLDAGLARLATVPLAAALRLSGSEPSTVESLAAALEFAGDLFGAAKVLRDHAWAREASESVCARWTHIAAMTGDLPAVRRAVGQLLPDGPNEPYRRRALDRLARVDALGPLLGDSERPEAALRWWDAVLQGTVLVHVSPFGVEVMGGRYAALFDDVDRLGQVLAGLDAALTAAAHGHPARVVAAPDRDSQILGWLLCARYGLDAPAWLDSPTTLEVDTPGLTLVAAYTWTGVLGEAASQRFRSDPTAVLFAYCLEWTRMHRLVPDVVGVEAQTIVPPWGERMRVDQMPGVDLPEGDRPQVTTIPADDREPAVVGADFAARAKGSRPDPEGARAVTTVVERLRDAGAPAGILGDHRDMWLPGGPFQSSQF